MSKFITKAMVEEGCKLFSDAPTKADGVRAILERFVLGKTGTQVREMLLEFDGNNEHEGASGFKLRVWMDDRVSSEELKQIEGDSRTFALSMYLQCVDAPDQTDALMRQCADRIAYAFPDLVNAVQVCNGMGVSKLTYNNWP